MLIIRHALLAFLAVCAVAASAFAQTSTTYYQVHTGGGAAMSLEGGTLYFAEAKGNVTAGTRYFSGTRTGNTIRGVFTYDLTKPSPCPPIYGGELVISPDGRSFTLSSAALGNVMRINGCQQPRPNNTVITGTQIHWPSRVAVAAVAPPAPKIEAVPSRTAATAPSTVTSGAGISLSISALLMKLLSAVVVLIVLLAILWENNRLARERGRAIGDDHNNLGKELAMWWLQSKHTGEPMTNANVNRYAIAWLIKKTVVLAPIMLGLWFFGYELPQNTFLYGAALFGVVLLLLFLWRLFAVTLWRTAPLRDALMQTPQHLGTLGGHVIGAATAPLSNGVIGINNKLETINAAVEGRAPALSQLQAPNRGALPQPVQAPIQTQAPAPEPVPVPVNQHTFTNPAQRDPRKVPVPAHPPVWSPMTQTDMLKAIQGKILGMESPFQRHYTAINFTDWQEFEGASAAARAFLAAAIRYHALHGHAFEQQRVSLAWEELHRMRKWVIPSDITSAAHVQKMSDIVEHDNKRLKAQLQPAIAS